MSCWREATAKIASGASVGKVSRDGHGADLVVVALDDDLERLADLDPVGSSGERRRDEEGITPSPATSPRASPAGNAGSAGVPPTIAS